MANENTEILDAIEVSNKATKAVRSQIVAFEDKWGDFDPANFEENAGGEIKERLAKAESGLDEALKLHEGFLAEQKAQTKLVEEMEAKLQALERSGPPPEEKLDESGEYTKAFDQWFRGGYDDRKPAMSRKQFKLTDDQIERLSLGYREMRKMEGAEIGWAQHKGLSTDSGEDGGYAMPAPLRLAMVKKLIEHSPMEDLASSYTLGDGLGDSIKIPAEGATDFDANWTSERGTRSETPSGNLRDIEITAHEMYAAPLITQKMLDDVAFDTPGWLNERLGRRFAVLSGAAYCVGNGDGKPSGIAVNAVAKTAYVASGAASTLTGDGFVTTYFALPDAYARNAKWVLQRTTLGLAFKLKDGHGDWIFNAGGAGIPPTIYTREYVEMPDMPAVAANAFSVGLGDWEAAYMVLKRQEARQMRDPYGTNKPNIEFYTTMRRGGAVILPEAYRLMKIAAS